MIEIPGDTQVDTLTHTYLHTCLNTSPFLRQAPLVSILWSCRLLVYRCKLAVGEASEEQQAWQHRGWRVLNSCSIHLLSTHISVKECFQLDSPGLKDPTHLRAQAGPGAAWWSSIYIDRMKLIFSHYRQGRLLLEASCAASLCRSTWEVEPPFSWD